MWKVSAHLMCALALGLTATACTRDDTRRTEGTAGTTGSAEAATVPVADLVAEPEKYFGKTVTVVADVEEVLGARVFAMAEDSPLSEGLDNDLLVFSRKSANLAEIDDQWLNNEVRVTGVVGRISVVDVEREIGWDIERQVEIELERAGAVLIANSVSRVGSKRRVR